MSQPTEISILNECARMRTAQFCFVSFSCSYKVKLKCLVATSHTICLKKFNI